MDEDQSAANDAIAESTLAFQFEERAYERAAAYPTYYRALGRAPRTAHPFYSYDDILRQPALVAETLQETAGAVTELARAVVQSGRRHVIFSGIGSSYHLAMSASQLIWRLVGMPAQWVDSAEALTTGTVFVYEEAVFVGLSASGNTAETVDHLHKARAGGALTLAVVNQEHTRLTAGAHEQLVAAGGYGLVFDYTTRLAALAAFGLALGRALGREDLPLDSTETALAQIPGQMVETLQRAGELAPLVGEQIQAMRAAVVTASGNQLPTAHEMALRFEEMAHFPARGRALVDFLHGAVGFLAPDIMTLLLAPDNSSYEYALRAAQVTRMIKTPALAIVDEDDERLAPLVDGLLRVPATVDLLKPLLYVLPGQLIPYYTEVAVGGNPDVQRTNRPNYARAFDIAMPPKSH